MRKKCEKLSWFILCVLGIFCLTACGGKQKEGKNETKRNTASDTKMQVPFVDLEVGQEHPENVGIWETKGGRLLVYRVTDQYLWFSFEDGDLRSDALYMRAEKQEDGKYHFHYGTKDSGHCYPMLTGGKEGILEFEENELNEYVDYNEWGEQGKSVYKMVKKWDAVPKMDVLNYLNDYRKAYQIYAENNLNFRYLGRDKESEKISYFYRGDAGFTELSYRKPFDYSFGKIMVASTKAECDQAWGKPVKIKKSKKGYQCIYQYEEYQISIYFSEVGSIYDMTLFLKSRKSALATYRVGDFEMRGSQITKYLNNNSGEKKVEFPENAVGIENNTFRNRKGKLKIFIPKDLILHEGAFQNVERAEIIFEEGRTEIPRYAFIGMAGSYTALSSGAEEGSEGVVDITVTLPKSVRVIKEGAFNNYYFGEKIHVNLNEGLEEIGDSAVRGLFLDFPESLKKIGDDAIVWPLYNGFCEKKLVLPPHLEEMGGRCIEFEEEGDGEGEQAPTEPVVTIPASVKKMGKNVVIGGTYVRE